MVRILVLFMGIEPHALGYKQLNLLYTNKTKIDFISIVVSKQNIQYINMELHIYRYTNTNYTEEKNVENLYR